MAEHAQLITALTSLGMLLVWVIYLQVFVSNYRRQTRATLLLTRGAGMGWEGRCFLTNMSSGPLYVQSVIVTLDMPGKRLVSPVTDVLDLEGDVPPVSGQRTRQGPLASGEIRDIGSFGGLVRHVLPEERGPAAIAAPVRAIAIEVLGIYGSEDLPVGARRRFVVLPGERPRIQGKELFTEQIRTRRERRRLLADLQRDR